jgi:NADPH-dependent 2,4-dienoyl-CoA reductase/sulfur reductase-like enzyme
MHVAIVGNGVAGMEAALAIRNREPAWDITLVSEESDHFFSRTALMYVLAGQLSYRDVEPLERDVYERMRFTRVRARAVGVDAAAKRLLIEGQDPIAYDRLVLACGSKPSAPPCAGGDLRGVGHFVSLQDLQWLEAEIHGRPGVDLPPRHELSRPRIDGSPYASRPVSTRGHPARKPVVIGGGLIGVEVVETMIAAGLRPTFLIREEWFWPIALDARESAWVADALRGHGVDVRLEEIALEIRDDGKGNAGGVRTSRGDIEADLVVVAIGVRPNTDWIGDAIARDEVGGILVDDRLRTSVRDIWACGDCTSVPCAHGPVQPEQLWYTARDQGRVAGASVLGDDVKYRRPVWYNSAKLMDIEYTTVGFVNLNRKGEENWFYEEKGRVRSTTRIVHANGRVIGFNFLGRRWDHSVCMRWIEERRSLDYVREHLNEAAFDTEFVPRWAGSRQRAAGS